MAQRRKAYLVSGSLKQYLFASVITMAVTNLNLMIDGILMGNFLGPEALAAINLCLPVLNVIVALGMLMSAGAVLIMANALGQMDRERVNEVFTLSSFAQWVVGLALLCLAKPLSGALSAFVCAEDALVPLCGKYIFVMLLGSVATMYFNSFSSFLQVSGYPKAVTVIVSLSVVVNLLMDTLLVKVLGTDIGGAALASVISGAAGILGFAVYSARKNGILRLQLPVGKPFAKLGEIVAKGIPRVIGIVSVILLQFICNTFVQKALGADGVFVLSIGFSLLGVGTMLANGLSSAFTAIGGSMMGQSDYQGLRFLFRRGMVICLLAGIGFELVSLILPRPLAALFGADTKELADLAARGIPMITTFILGITIQTPYSMHFQVLGRFTFSSVSNFSVLGSVLVSFLLVSALFPNDWIWLAFPLCCILALLILFVGICAVKAACGKRVTFPDLIPSHEPEVRKLDLSVACTREAFLDAMRELWDFLEKNGCGKLSFRVAHCAEELLLNTVMHSGGDESHYIDVLVRETDEELIVLLKDDGIPFNTSVCLSEGKSNGLVMAHHFCDSIQYSYLFGQNMTMMKWQLKQDETI